MVRMPRWRSFSSVAWPTRNSSRTGRGQSFSGISAGNSVWTRSGFSKSPAILASSLLLLDYKLSTFMDHPHLEAEFVENYEPTSAFGAKALGEPPTCSPAPAIRNAILQATGVAVNDAPVNPHRMFDAFTEAGLI